MALSLLMRFHLVWPTAQVAWLEKLFPAGAAGDFTYQRAVGAQSYTLREPRKTFRFSVATTF